MSSKSNKEDEESEIKFATSFKIWYQNSLKTCPNDLIRFFQQINKNKKEYIAKEFASLNYLLEKNNGMYCYKLHENKRDSLIRDLLLFRSKRVAIFDKIEANPKLLKSGSPGNYQDFEDIMMSDQFESSNSSVMAISINPKNTEVAFAVCNTNRRLFEYTLFVDNELLAILESAIIQTFTKEVLYAPTGVGYLDEKNRRRVGFIILSIENFKKDDRELIGSLEKLLKEEEAPDFQNKDLVGAMSCLSCLIEYLDLVADTNNFGYFHLNPVNLNQFMKLETSALMSLNILRSPNEIKSMSLYGLLDQCKTKIGTRMLEEWIRQPLIKVEEIEQRLDIVEAFMQDSVMREKFREEIFRIVPDMDGILKRFQRLKGGLKDIVKVYQFIKSISRIIDALSGYDGNHKDMLNALYTVPFTDILTGFNDCIEMVDKCIDLNRTKKHEYFIAEGYDADLDEIRERLVELESRMEMHREELEGVICDKIEEEKNASHGHVFRTHSKYQRELEQLEGLEQISCSKSKFIFTFPVLQDLSKELEEITNEYVLRQNSLEEKMVSVFASYLPLAEELSHLISSLDILCSFATVSLTSPIEYVRPIILDSSAGRLMLSEARHPCLEIQDGVSFIPNDIEFDSKKKHFWIVTGCNMGGKSTFIRQTAVITLMAQIGCFVPCKDAVISIRTSIRARIGASDSQLRGVSTFMAEMLETSSILKCSDENSLVVIDELGRGTSTFDGYGLAYSIANAIATQNKSFTIFATHFHELAALESEHKCIGNKYVSTRIDDKSIIMLHKVKDGSTDQSYGINVARIAKFPLEVITLAEKRVHELESNQNLNHRQKRYKSDHLTSQITQVLTRYSHIDFTREHKDTIGDTLESLFHPQ